MPFKHDDAVAAALGDSYGEYKDTFFSSTEQVSAYLFIDGDTLVAHVSFAPGLGFDNVTDNYLSELKQYAIDAGYGEDLRIIYADA